MSTTYRTVETALAARLATAKVAVDFGGAKPRAEQVKRAYVDPPASIEPSQVPCVLIGDAPFEDDWASDYALGLYRQECLLLIRPASAATAPISVRLAKAYREAIRDLLRAGVKLGSAYAPAPSPVTISGVSFDAIETVLYGERLFFAVGFDVAITLNDEAPGFAAG